MVEAQQTIVAQAQAILAGAGQEEALANLNSRSGDDQTKFAEEIVRLDQVTPTGMKQYCERARKLLEDSRNNVNPFEKYKPQIPNGVKLTPGEDEFDAMEQAGLAELSKLCIVLIAGGLGERLGYSGIKVSLPVCSIDSNYSYMQYYSEYALACEAKARELDPSLKDDFFVPFGIMVSDDTRARTEALLKENNNFGLKSAQIFIIKQENVPALMDNNARLAIDQQTGKILTKPHGHGDIHNLLFEQGVAEKWRDLGKEWMIFIQDTNALALRCLTSVLGVSAKNNWQMNTVCVPRKPGEAMGAACHLVSEDGSGDEITISVEYNQLDALLRAKWNKDGDIQNEQGYSHFPGNTNTLIFKIPEYVENLKKTGGVIPEFVNPKYANAERTLFKSPTRLECMMQDYPKLLVGAKNSVGYTTYDTWYCMSPVKNNFNDALATFNKGLPSYGAAQGEWDFYNWTNKMLKIAGVGADQPVQTVDCNGIKLDFALKILLKPSYGLTFKEIREKIQQACSQTADLLTPDPNSTVTCQGSDVNKIPQVIKPLEESDPEIFRIRGFKMDPQ